MTPGEGERLEAERRKTFWRLILGLAAAGAIGGFAFGFSAGWAEASGHELSDTARTLAGAALLLSAILGLYGSWRFFVTVDEVEVADNLWGSLVGFYLYAFTFPVWWGLNRLRLAPEPNDWVIFAAALVSALAAYGVRKWRSR